MKLDAIGIVVKDMAVAVDFYSRLGLTFPELEEGAGHIEAVTESGFRFMLDSEELVANFMEGWQPQRGNLFSTAFLMDSPSEVDAKYQEMVEAGYEGHKEPWDAFWGQRYACLKDPSGNGVDLFASLES